MVLTTIIPHLPGLQVDHIESFKEHITIYAHALAKNASCPLCGQSSSSIHSRYFRHPKDLPTSGKRVRLVLQVRRYFCQNTICRRKTFAEQFLSFVSVRAQRTIRLDEALRTQVIATSAEGGARVLRRWGMPVSADTLLRIIRHLPMPEYPTPRVLGVDDWAYLKGRKYGTLLCDLERHCVVDLLPDNSAETFVRWLQAHPGVEIISRDRSPIYADGASRGAPDAVQVVDRWHLLKNLSDTVHTILRNYNQFLNKDIQQQRKSSVTTTLPSKLSKAEKRRLENAAQRRALYDKAMALSQQGIAQHLIADQLGISLRTVSYFVNKPKYPERKRRHRGESIIEPFIPQLCRLFDAGCQNVSQLWRMLSASGYAGSYGTVYNVVQRLRKGLPPLRTKRSVKVRPKRYTPRQARWLFASDPNVLKPEDAHNLKLILSHPDLAELYQLTQTFISAVRHQELQTFEDWLVQATNCKFSALRRFARGLHWDYAEVKAAFILPWSNGQSEGHINRLKLVKRQMYGRAKFDLLRQRMLHSV